MNTSSNHPYKAVFAIVFYFAFPSTAAVILIAYGFLRLLERFGFLLVAT